MKYGKRFLALALSLVVALGSVCYRAPKAEAYVGGMVANMCLSAYMSATGLSLVPDIATAERLSSFIDSLIPSFINDKSEEIGGITKDVFIASIVNGCTISTTGLLHITAPAARLMGVFTGWLINKISLENGEYGIEFECPAEFILADGKQVVVHPYDGPYPDTLDEWYGSQLNVGESYTFANGTVFDFSKKNDKGYYVLEIINASGSSIYETGTSNIESGVFGFWHQGSKEAGYYDDLYWIVIFGNNNQHVTISTFTLDKFFGAPMSVDASLADDYGGPLNPEDDQKLVIDLCVPFTDTQTFVDDVMNKASLGELNPSSTIENTTTGDVVVPDEDTEHTGILNWVKQIAQDVKALPKAIAEAVANIFVPDVALMTEISDTFNAKFGFLSTLHDLGSDLLSINADSEPPVVYIHLEDAEGSLDYGGTVKALDMSWYQRYKADGDRILSGFLWLGFLWLLFKRAPAIINGGEMVSDYGHDLSDGFRRKKR